MRAPRTGTVALIVRLDGASPTLVNTLSDDREIDALETELKSGNRNPMATVLAVRERQTKEDEEFGDYIENLLSKPFVKPEIQEHGVQWLKSKMKIEQFQEAERRATKVIADYAFKLFLETPKSVDFFLAGQNARVRIRIFVLDQEAKEQAA